MYQPVSRMDLKVEREGFMLLLSLESAWWLLLFFVQETASSCSSSSLSVQVMALPPGCMSLLC